VPSSPLAVGHSLRAAKEALDRLIGECPSVDLVVNGGARREVPDRPGIVWITGTTNVTQQTGRGGLGTETFDLQVLVESSRKWERVPAGPDQEQRQEDADDAARTATLSLRWDIAGEIAQALADTPGALGTSSANLVVSSEHDGFVDGYWIARVYAYVRCTKFRAG
jgi:hypothetical protein